jgi:hypothetical protein
VFGAGSYVFGKNSFELGTSSQTLKKNFFECFTGQKKFFRVLHRWICNFFKYVKVPSEKNRVWQDFSRKKSSMEIVLAEKTECFTGQFAI